MKKIALLITIFIGVVLFTSCNSHKELYEKTDYFVESLQTTYESYGIFSDDFETTEDGLYTIHPIGRLINVKIQKEVDDKEYEKLRKDLEKHYKDNYHVNKVYICNGGTVMIDCRN
jgi:hypothetical protein